MPLKHFSWKRRKIIYNLPYWSFAPALNPALITGAFMSVSNECSSDGPTKQAKPDCPEPNVDFTLIYYWPWRPARCVYLSVCAFVGVRKSRHILNNVVLVLNRVLPFGRSNRLQTREEGSAQWTAHGKHTAAREKNTFSTAAESSKYKSINRKLCMSWTKRDQCWGNH